MDHFHSKIKIEEGFRRVSGVQCDVLYKLQMQKMLQINVTG
jgi:hypothetical protein